jgi:hypothetical protein
MTSTVCSLRNSAWYETNTTCDAAITTSLHAATVPSVGKQMMETFHKQRDVNPLTLSASAPCKQMPLWSKGVELRSPIT